jgi:hypothetical protein
MNRKKWAAPEKLQNLVFGLDLLGKTIVVFSSKASAVANVEGLAIAEGDWRFFSADGSPLEAHFSMPAQIHPERNTYTNGVYTLEPAATGANLFALLSIVACEDQARSGLCTLRDIEQFLLDRTLGEDFN